MSVSGAMGLFSISTSAALASLVRADGESSVSSGSARLMLKYLQACRRFLLAFTSPIKEYTLDERVKDVASVIATIRSFSKEATARKRRDTLLPMPCLAGFDKDAAQLLNRWISTLMWASLQAKRGREGTVAVEVEFSPWATTSQPAESLFREWRTRGKSGTAAADIDIPDIEGLVATSTLRTRHARSDSRHPENQTLTLLATRPSWPAHPALPVPPKWRPTHLQASTWKSTPQNRRSCSHSCFIFVMSSTQELRSLRHTFLLSRPPGHFISFFFLDSSWPRCTS